MPSQAAHGAMPAGPTRGSIGSTKTLSGARFYERRAWVSCCILARSSASAREQLAALLLTPHLVGNAETWHNPSTHPGEIELEWKPADLESARARLSACADGLQPGLNHAHTRLAEGSAGCGHGEGSPVAPRAPSGGQDCRGSGAGAQATLRAEEPHEHGLAGFLSAVHTLELTRMQYKGLTLDIEHIPFDLTSLGSLRVLRVHSQDMLTEKTLEALLGAKACGSRAALTELDLSGQHAVAPALFDSFLSSGALMHLNLLRLRSTALEVWMAVCAPGCWCRCLCGSCSLAFSSSSASRVLPPLSPCMCVCMYACMYVCMHACMHT